MQKNVSFIILLYLYMDIYGVLNSDGVHIDISKSLKVAKRYAVINGYDTISVRYNMGYNVLYLYKNISKTKRAKWQEID